MCSYGDWLNLNFCSYEIPGAEVLAQYKQGIHRFLNMKVCTVVMCAPSIATATLCLNFPTGALSLPVSAGSTCPAPAWVQRREEYLLVDQWGKKDGKMSV